MGRKSEVRVGLATLDAVVAGRGSVLLVGGEPGIGKSRLAQELALRAQERGFHVAWGRCWEAGGAPAYWPWVQALRLMERNATDDQLSARDTEASSLAQLFSDRGMASGALQTSAQADPDTARFQLFESVAELLKRWASAQSLMIVLDDLHAADIPTLLLLRFLTRSLSGDRLFLLGTYRTTELKPEHPLTEAVAELLREQSVQQLTLRGLSTNDISEFVSSSAGFVPLGSLAEAVRERTDGNPLFLHELLGLLREEGRLHEGMTAPDTALRIPRSVLEVIRRRLRPLPTASLEVLSLASIFGREFAIEALSRLARQPVHEIFASLDPAISAQIVSDVPASKGRLSFSHVLIREALYGDIPRARRMELHGLAAVTLESLYAGDIELHLAEIALHFAEASLGGDATRAVEYSRRAAAHAVSVLAYEEAVRLYRMSLQALELSPGDDASERCEILLALGDAQARAGDEAGSKESLLRAAELSKHLGLRESLARAAVGYGGRLVWVRAGGDPHLIPLLEEALTVVGDHDSPLRARILARLGGALRDDPDPERRETLAQQAVDMARRLGDLSTLAYTLDGLCAALWRPDIPYERLGFAEELISVGTRVGDRERVISGHQYRVWTFLELCDIASVYQELDVINRLSLELRQAAHGWLPASIQQSLVLITGRFSEAESLMPLARQQRRRTNQSDAIMSYTLNLFQLRREQGRLDEVDQPLSEAAREFTWYPDLRCAMALLHCELGHNTHARAEFESLAGREFRVIPFDNKWLFAMCLLSEVARHLGDADRAQILYARLLDYADRNAVAAGDGYLGSVSRYLGLLAATVSHYDEAARHFQTALQVNERMGAAPFVAHTKYDYALMLLARAAPGDAARAVALLAEVRAACDQLGMRMLDDKVAKVVAALEGEQRVGETRASAGTSAAAHPQLGGRSLGREGEYWTIEFDGRVIRLRDSKGLRILARLLREPGRPYPALDLERLDTPGDDTTARAVASGDAGEIIDDEARHAYQARRDQLREQIDEAEALGKPDLAGALREELDFITHELVRAIGLGGRSRRAGSVAERARLNVTRAVKSAVRRVAAADGGLADHLAATVHTGSVCVYSPDPRSSPAWTVLLS